MPVSSNAWRSYVSGATSPAAGKTSVLYSPKFSFGYIRARPASSGATASISSAAAIPAASAATLPLPMDYFGDSWAIDSGHHHRFASDSTAETAALFRSRLDKQIINDQLGSSTAVSAPDGSSVASAVQNSSTVVAPTAAAATAATTSVNSSSSVSHAADDDDDLALASEQLLSGQFSAQLDPDFDFESAINSDILESEQATISAGGYSLLFVV